MDLKERKCDAFTQTCTTGEQVIVFWMIVCLLFVVMSVKVEM